jgi:molybdopterin synthase catalytic subunit
MTSDARPDTRPDTRPDVRPDARPDTSRISAPARRVVHTEVTPQPIDVTGHAALVAGASSGAVVTFAGVVRDHDHGRVVQSLEYSAHPSASAVLARVVAEVVAGSDVEAAAVSHRVGPLSIGDAALVVAVAGAHRAEAFATAMTLVDEVKRQLPVWKRQIFPDGTDEWVDCP